MSFRTKFIIELIKMLKPKCPKCNEKEKLTPLGINGMRIRCESCKYETYKIMFYKIKKERDD